MRRNNKRARRIRLDAASLPMVGLISMIFLLFSYYMVTHRPEPENNFFDISMDVSVDDARGISALNLEIRKVYAADEENIFFMNGRPFYLKDLVPVMKDLSRTAPGIAATVTFSPEAKYQKLLNLIDACASSGISKVRIVAEKN